MSPQRWNRVREVFDSAVDRDPAEAEEFLRRECADDPELYSEVRRMLDQHGQPGFLDTPVGVPPGFQPGETVAGRYRIVRAIGRGGMGQVYEAEEIELQERVALKTLLPEIAADIGMINRFKREIQLARRIGHPNVCKVYDLGRHPLDGSSPAPVLFLTMEFLPGETLSDRIDRAGRIAPPEALRLLGQIADALDTVHRTGIVHRDLKPSNVMLTPGPRGTLEAGECAVVTDFGLARSIGVSGESTQTGSGQLVGTLDYMAPELFKGSPATPASDIYALALVAYKMVTGGLPFASDSPLEGVIRRAGEAVPAARSKAPEITPAWDQAFTRALDPDPTRRFPTCAAFIAALRGEAHSVTLRLPLMNRRKWVGAAAAAALVLAAPFAWQAWQRAKARPSPEAETVYQQGVANLHAGAYFAASKALEQAVKLAPNFALAHARLAEAWTGLDLNEKAKQEMLLVRRLDLGALSKLDRLQVDAIDFTITREFAKAAAKYEEITRAGREDVYVDLGRAWQNAGSPEKAIKAYQHAAEGGSGNPAAWLRLAVVYSRAGDAAKADAAFARAEEHYRASSNLEGLTQLLLERGVAANRRGDTDRAREILQKALGTAELAENPQQQIVARLNLATNAYLKGDGGTAAQYAAAALELAQASHMEGQAASGLVTLGAAYLTRRQFADAEQAYQKALALSRTSGSARLQALSHYALAALYSQLRQSDKTAAEAAEALAFFQPNHWASETFNCLLLLGRTRRDGGDYKSAHQYATDLLNIARGSGDRGQLAIAHELLASVYTKEEDYPEAIAHERENVELVSVPIQKGYARLGLADGLQVLGRFDEAIALLDEVEKTAESVPSLRVSLLVIRSNLALNRSDYTAAITLSRKTLALDSAGPNSTELNRTLGLAMIGIGQASDGLRYCRQSLEAAEAIHNAGASLAAKIAVLSGYVRTNSAPKAREWFREIQAELTAFPESRWRALALMSSIDDSFRQSASDALETLRQQWSEDAMRSYLTRKDIQDLARPLSHPVSATH
jgi:tetratricopeptide (TPR) repeat protein